MAKQPKPPEPATLQAAPVPPTAPDGPLVEAFGIAQVPGGYVVFRIETPITDPRLKPLSPRPTPRSQAADKLKVEVVKAFFAPKPVARRVAK